jgi:hypothetical protein
LREIIMQGMVDLMDRRRFMAASAAGITASVALGLPLVCSSAMAGSASANTVGAARPIGTLWMGMHSVDMSGQGEPYIPPAVVLGRT